MDRTEKIEQKGSPTFTIKLGVIAAGVAVDYDPETESNSALKNAAKYLPFDFLQVINNDAVEVEITVNNSQTFYIPPSTIEIINSEKIWRFAVKNLDGATSTTANKITLTLKRKPIDADEFARRQARKPRWPLGGLFSYAS